MYQQTTLCINKATRGIGDINKEHELFFLPRNIFLLTEVKSIKEKERKMIKQ
jgi:hypothetical protein